MLADFGVAIEVLSMTEQPTGSGQVIALVEYRHAEAVAWAAGGGTSVSEANLHAVLSAANHVVREGQRHA